MKKQEKKTKTHRHRQQCGGTRGKGLGGNKRAKGDQIYDDGRSDFGSCAQNAIHK